MEQQKWYQVDLYIGLLDPDELLQKFTTKEAVDTVTNIIGDCTIIPAIGSYTHSSGIRINMNSIQVIKFINCNPTEFINNSINKLKKIFNQDCIIVKTTECTNLEIL